MKHPILAYRAVAASAVALLFVAGSSARATTYNWITAIGGGWNTSTNWNPIGVPGATDTAIITNAGVTVLLNTATTIGAIILGTNGPGTVTLLLNNQTLALNGPFTVNPSGSFIVDSGALVGNTNAVLHGTIGWSAGFLEGILTLASGSTLNITTANNHDMPNCTLTNYGTVAWASGDIRSGSSGTTIYNYGLWDAQSDQQLNTAGYNGSTVFDNFGTFRKSGGANVSQTLVASSVLFNQPSGVLDVRTGNVVLQGSGNFNGGYITTNSTGTTYLSQGSFNINGTATGTNVIENAGSLVGTNVINGALNWVAGSWNGITLTILSNSVVTVSGGGGNNDMPNCTLTNYGTLAWASGDIRSGSSGTTIYNYGLWDAQSDHQLTISGYNGTTMFNNFGALRKSSGNNASQTLFSAGVFLNQLAGAVDVRQGNLDLQGGGSLTGGTANNPAGTIYLSSGRFNINGGLSWANVAPSWLHYDVPNFFDPRPTCVSLVFPISPLHNLDCVGIQPSTATLIEQQVVEVMNALSGSITSVSVQATLDGNPWTGSFGYTLAGPSAQSGNGPHTYNDVVPGTYTLAYTVGGPSANPIVLP